MKMKFLNKHYMLLYSKYKLYYDNSFTINWSYKNLEEKINSFVKLIV